MNGAEQMQSEFAAAADAVAVKQNVQVMRLVTALLQSKRSLLLLSLGFAVLAYCLSLPIKNHYTAITRVLPPQLHASTAVSMLGGLSMGGDAGGLASLGSAFQTKSQGDSFMVLLTAWPVLNAVVQDQHLQQIYHAKTMSAARIALSGSTALASEKGFVTISVTDVDPNRAAAIANAYIEKVRDSMRGMALTDASQRRIFYEAQLTKAKDDLANAEASFKTTQQSTNMLSLDSQARTLLTSGATLQSQITAQEVELQRLRTYLTDNNPQLQIAETSLAALRAQLAQVESQNRSGFTGGSLANVPQAELTFIRATREVKYREALYDLMVKQYEASRIDEARTAPVIQVVEPALAPEVKSGPHRSIFALTGLLLGVVVWFLLGVYRFWRAGLDHGDLQRLTDFRRAALRW